MQQPIAGSTRARSGQGLCPCASCNWLLHLAPYYVVTSVCVCLCTFACTWDKGKNKKKGEYRMAGNFGGKIFWRIAEFMTFGGFTLTIEKVLAIMIFIAKWLIERTGNLTGP